MDDEERKALFNKLVEEKAGCFEFAWNGFIRMYEEGEKRCECKDCKSVEKLKQDFDKIYSRVPIDKKCHQTDEGKQKLLDILNEKFSFEKDGTICCRECKNESVACVCMGEENE